MTNTPTHSPCSLCGHALREVHDMHLCGTCYQGLLAVGSASVPVTGEFEMLPLLHQAQAMLDMEVVQAAAEATNDDAAPPAEPGAMPVQCSWCRRREDEVKKLLSRAHVHICNECVALCADILETELGDGWRS